MTSGRFLAGANLGGPQPQVLLCLRRGFGCDGRLGGRLGGIGIVVAGNDGEREHDGGERASDTLESHQIHPSWG